MYIKHSIHRCWKGVRWAGPFIVILVFSKGVHTPRKHVRRSRTGNGRFIEIVVGSVGFLPRNNLLVLEKSRAGSLHWICLQKLNAQI